MLNLCSKLPLAIVATVLMSASLAVSAQADSWYRPDSAYFRSVYAQDLANRRVEPWDGHRGYWHWVEIFYGGYEKRILGVSVIHEIGWTAAGEQMESRLCSDIARKRLRQALNSLGRQIAAEWAKDDSNSRIHDSDLRRWGGMTREAASRDDGSGQDILATIARIQAEVNQKLAVGAG